MFRKTASLASAGVLALALGAAAGQSAQASTSTQSGAAGTAAACSLRLGSVTANGAATSRTINATSPITVGGVRGTAGVFGPKQVQHSSTVVGTPLGSGEARSGLTVIGGALYASSYVVDGQSQLDPHYPHNNLRVGGGWGNYRWIEQSILRPANAGDPARTLLYGQRTDGTTLRWIAEGTSWRATGGVGGLTTVKGIALISRTATAETFLANTRTGALVTVTWPTKYNAVPSSRVVRGSTWQGFEQLIATKCGTNGTLLLGIDRDTKSGYLYAVSHANGTNTVIKSLGKVPLTFSDPQYFRIAPKADPLNGA
ncbi:hypothetical protein [Kribbella solani]|uniref:Uncharacterized protein n=1 Tax=Kribbella solani TaxID=236067 RepID=A0A841DH90_9ACTN|nr:hypothetical protein [Kribbella solani]MBB5977862.1 hypothetical protein [Kribbella solani]